MVKIGMIQTASYKTNQIGISKISKMLKDAGRREAEIICLPEQWLKNNEIPDMNSEFSDFKKIAKEFSMTIIPGAFYEKKGVQTSIVAPVIGPEGEFIGMQEKIHPFDYEKDGVKPGNEAKVFKTACRFGVIVCYDMVFPKVANTLVKKGAQVLLSPCRIVKRGIEPWQMYVQVRALENRVPILAANVENHRFGGTSTIVDLVENNKVVITKVTQIDGEKTTLREFALDKYEKNRKTRFSDSNNFK